MEEIQKETLRRCQSMIVDNMHSEFEMWDLLIQNDVLTPAMMDSVKAKPIRQEKNRQILELLPTRGKHAYESFIDCLKISKQADIADSLLEEESKIRQQSESDLSRGACKGLTDQYETFEPIMDYYGTTKKYIEIPVVIRPKISSDCSAVIHALCDIDGIEEFIRNKEKSLDFHIIAYTESQNKDAITWKFHVDSTKSVKLLKDLVISKNDRLVGHLRQFLKRQKMFMELDFEIEAEEGTFIYCSNYFDKLETSDSERQEKMFYLYIKSSKRNIKSVVISFQDYALKTKNLKRCQSDKLFLEKHAPIVKDYEKIHLENLWYTVVPVSGGTKYFYTIECHNLTAGTILEDDKCRRVTRSNIIEPELDVFNGEGKDKACIAFSLIILYTFEKYGVAWGFSMIQRTGVQSIKEEKYRKRLGLFINDIFEYHLSEVDVNFCLLVIPMLVSVPKCIDKKYSHVLLKACKRTRDKTIIPISLTEIYATSLINLYQMVFSEDKQSFIHFLIYTYPFLNESQEFKILSERFIKPRSPLMYKQKEVEILVSDICSRVEKNQASPEWQTILRHLFEYLQTDIDTVLQCLGILNSTSSVRRIKEEMIVECKHLISAAIENTDLKNLPEMLNVINENYRSELTTLITSACLNCIFESCDKYEGNLNYLKRLCIDCGLIQDQNFRQKILKHLASTTTMECHSLLVTILGDKRFPCNDKELAEETINTCFQNVIKSLQGKTSITYMYSFLSSVFGFISTIDESKTLQEELKEKALQELRKRKMEDIIDLVISKDRIENQRAQDILCANVYGWMASQKKNNIQIFFSKLCDGNTMMLIHKSYQANIVVLCMEVSGLSTDMNLEKAMQEILDQQHLWKYVLKYHGEYAKIILGHTLAIKAKQTILDSRRLLKSHDFGMSFIARVCNQKGMTSWEDLYGCVSNEAWLKSELINLEENVNNTSKDNKLILEELRVIEGKGSNYLTISRSLCVVLRLTEKCMTMFQNNEIPYKHILHLRKNLQDYEKTLLSRKLLSSEIFCLTNMQFIREVKWKFEDTNILCTTGNISSQAPQRIKIQPELSSSDFCEEIINSENVMEVISTFKSSYDDVYSFVQNVADRKNYYHITWSPVIKRCDVEEHRVKVKDVDLLCCTNYSAEHDLARDILQVSFDENCSKALEKLSSFHEHKENAALICELLDIFSKVIPQEHTPVFLDAAKKMISLDIRDVTLFKIGKMLDEIYKITCSLTPKMRNLIAVLRDSQNMISFVQETIDEDIRNLINAVEYSDQHISESVVSAFIQVHEFLSQLLGSHTSGEFETFIKELRKYSDRDKIELKIQSCCNNLYNLQRLRENMSSRTEMTRKTVEEIMQNGTFHFSFCANRCIVDVSYKNESGIVTQTHLQLADIRSKALLIMNTSTGGDVTLTEDHFQKFVSIADTAINICYLYTDLHKTGYDDHSSLIVSMKTKQLEEHFDSLQKKTSDWEYRLQNCRKKHYYMNFICGNQIQSLMRYFSENDFENDLPSVLKYINPTISLDYLRTLQWLKEQGKVNAVEELADVLDKLFAGKLSKRKSKGDQRILMDSEHCHKQIYFAKLDAESRSIVQTLLTMFHRVTGTLPEANQVIFCCEETSWEEVYNLLERFRYEPDSENKKLYCLACTDLLSLDIQSRLMNYMEKVIYDKSTHSLAIIHRGSEHSSIVKYFKCYMTDMTPLNRKEIDKYMENLFSDVFVVYSERPGLGKTETIFEEAASKTKNVVTMHISGSVKKADSVEHLLSLPLNKHSLLHIDIGEVDNESMLDIFLFEILALRYASVQSICFYLPRQVPVGVEISCIKNQKLVTPTFCRKFHLNADIMGRLKISKEPTSDIQVVCYFLHQLDIENLENEDTVFSETSVLNTEECRNVLRKHFNIMHNRPTSFTRINTFISVFADQLKRLTTSRYFKKDQLNDMFGPENKIKMEMVKALEYISHLFAKSPCQSNQSHHLSNPGDSTETVISRMHGMIHWEDDQKILMLFNNKDKQTFSILYKEIGHVPEEIRSLFMDQKICLPQCLMSMSHIELRELLIKISRSSQTPVLPEILDKLFKQYVLTPDNLLKMILILLRIQSSVPVVIIGETGCGKTSLVKYLAYICGNECKVVNIHPGVGSSEIEAEVNKLNVKALNNLDMHFWMFLDEINTSNHIGFLSEILCHHKCCGNTLAPNIVFIAACNPYKPRNPDTALTAGLRSRTTPDKRSNLVYRVHPLPETMMDYVWDFGSLSDTDEKAYVTQMVSFFDENEQWHSGIRTVIVDLLSKSQCYVRDAKRENYSVSLRDAKRCIHLIRWFENFYLQKREIACTNIKETAIILAASVCYYCRFQNWDNRHGYLKVLEKTFESNSLQGYDINAIEKVLRKEQTYILDNMEMPAGIAKNTCLLENVFTMLVAVLNKIPLFLVGKPGCSKSLSMQLITSNMRGKKSKKKFFLNFPELYPVSFQGSEASTSEGIQNVFAKAKSYQDHTDTENVVSLVVLDEVGLADASKWNPLKVLHSLLEPEGEIFCNVAVIGISNYALDAAKMNRVLHLSRADMEEDELIKTGSSILADICEENNEDLQQVESNALSALAKAYIEYVKYVNSQKTLNFIGLRDFYALMKFIGTTLSSSQHAAEHDLNNVIMKGVLRNFGGSDPTEACNVFRKHLGVTHTFKASVEQLIRENIIDQDCRHLMIIANGDSILTRLYEIINDSNRQFVTLLGSHFIDDQTEDTNYRILSQIILCMEQGKILILKDLETVYGSLYDMLNQHYSTFDNRKYCRIALGSVVSPLCLVHEDFKCIVLMEDENCQASDPPFLNRFEKQKWVLQDTLSDAQSQILRILSSEFENMWRIFDDSDKNHPFDIAPIFADEFLPSLSVKLSKMLSLTEINVKEILASFSNEIKWIAKPESIIRLYGAYKSKKYTGAVDLKQLLQDYFATPLHLGLISATRNLSVSSSFKMETKVIYRYDQDAKNMDENVFEAVSHVDDSSAEMYPQYEISMPKSDKTRMPSKENNFLKLMIFSNSPCICLSTKPTFSCHMLSEITSKKQLENIVQTFWSSADKGVLVIQCDTNQSMRNIHFVKNIMDDYQKQYIRKHFETYKHICLVFHLHRNNPDVLRNKLGFLTDWKLITLDSAKEPTESLPSMYNRSIGSIITERHDFLNKCIESNILWAISRIQYEHMVSRPVGWMMQTVENITNNSILMKAFNSFLGNFIIEEMSDDNWIDEVAFDVCKLATAPNFISALECRLDDTVKEALAMLVYRLEELSTFTIANNKNNSELKLKAWAKHLNDPKIVSLDDVGQPTGPCCFVIGEKVLNMKAPFSKYFINKIESLRQTFINTVEEQYTAKDFEDEDITEHMLEAIVNNFTRHVEKEVNPFIVNSYAGIKEDYIHDFCLHVCSLHTCVLLDEEKVVATKFAISQSPYLAINFSEIDQLTLSDIVTRCHTTLWLHHDSIMDVLKVLQLVKLMGLDFTKAVDKIDPVSKSFDAIVELVFGNLHSLSYDELCIASWQREMNGIFTLIGQVTDMQLVHGLRFCHELLTLFTLPYKQGTKYVIHMINYISTGNRLSSRKMFDIVWNMVKDIQSLSVVPDSVLQNTVCIYVNRCLSCMEDNVPEAVICLLERIEQGDLFDKHFTYFQPTLTSALQQYCQENEFEAVVHSETKCRDIVENNELLRHIHRGLESNQELATPLSVILVNVLQNVAFQTILQTDCLDSCQSDSDIIIVLAHSSKNALVWGQSKFRKLVATAFLKLFIGKLIQENSMSLQNKTVRKCIKDILPTNDQSDASEQLVYFLIRSLENDEDTLNLQKRFNDIELGIEIELNQQTLERSFDERPLASFFGESYLYDEGDIMMKHEHIEQLQQFLTSEHGLMKFWMYHIWIYVQSCRTGENKMYNVLSEDVYKFTKTFERSKSHTRLLTCLLGKEEFGNETLDLNSNITMRKLQTASFVLQLSCICIGYCSEGSFWNSLILSPTSVKNGIMSIEKSVFSPVGNYVANRVMSCRLNHRFVSTNRRCCICEGECIYEKSIENERSDDAVGMKIRTTSFISKKVLLLMIWSGITMAVALRNIEESELLTLLQEDSQSDALKRLTNCTEQIWSELLKLLQVSSKKLGRILQTLLCQLKDELRDVNLNNTENIQNWEVKITEKINSVLVNKETMLQRQIALHKQVMGVRDEYTEVSVIGSNAQETIPNSHYLFGNLVSPSPSHLHAKLVLSGKDQTFPFLCLVLENLTALQLPQCITHIVKWHAAVSSVCKFRVSRIDSKRQVEDFITRLSENAQTPLRKTFQSLKDQLEHLNIVLLKDNNLKRKCPDVKQLLNPDNMEDLLMLGEKSNLYALLKTIVRVQNSFIDEALKIAAFTNCLNINFLKKHEDASAVYGIHVTDAKPDDLINYDNMDDILQFSQNDIPNIDSMNIHYDFGKIENSLALKLLYRKPFLVLPYSPLRVVFRDEQFENSVCMLREIGNIISQTMLSHDTRKYILAEIETKQSIALDLLTITGISLAIIMDTGGDPDTSLLDFLDKWKEKFLHLPECTSFLKSMEINICLCHVVGFYKFLEEVNGNIETAALKEEYKDELSEEQKRFIAHSMDRHTQDHVSQALKIFIHRRLNGKSQLNPTLSLNNYLSDHGIWCDGCIVCTQNPNLKEEAIGILSKSGLRVGHIYSLVHLLKEKHKYQRVDIKHPKQRNIFDKKRPKTYL